MNRLTDINNAFNQFPPKIQNECPETIIALQPSEVNTR
jgi:hypothetical protein